jgi:hypothetical protein
MLVNMYRCVCVCVFETHFMFLQSTMQQWRTVFWIVFGVFVVTNLLFVLMASGEIQPWNNTSTMKQGGEEACTSEQNSITGKSRQCTLQHYPHIVKNTYTALHSAFRKSLCT